MKEKDSGRFEESENYMDKLQDEGYMSQEDKEVQQEPMNSDLKEDAKAKHSHEARFNKDNVELDIPIEEFHPAPQKVEAKDVLYMPRKTFGARVNQDEFEFTKGVRTRVSRDLAALLLEDEDRGYVMEE